MRLPSGTVLVAALIATALPAEAVPVTDPSWQRADVGTAQGLRGRAARLAR